MKMFVTMIMVTGLLGANAQAQVGPQKGDQLECTKVVQKLEAKLKEMKKADSAPDSSGTREEATPGATSL